MKHHQLHLTIEREQCHIETNTSSKNKEKNWYFYTNDKKKQVLLKDLKEEEKEEFKNDETRLYFRRCHVGRITGGQNTIDQRRLSSLFPVLSVWERL